MKERKLFKKSLIIKDKAQIEKVLRLLTIFHFSFFNML